MHFGDFFHVMQDFDPRFPLTSEKPVFKCICWSGLKINILPLKNAAFLELCKNDKEMLYEIYNTLLLRETKQLAMTWNSEAGS